MAVIDIGAKQIVKRVTGWPRSFDYSQCHTLQYQEELLFQTKDNDVKNVLGVIFDNVLIFLEKKKAKHEWNTAKKLKYVKHYMMTQLVLDEDPTRCLQMRKHKKLTHPFLLKNTSFSLTSNVALTANKLDVAVLSPLPANRYMFKDQLHAAICSAHRAATPEIDQNSPGWMHKYRVGTVLAAAVDDDSMALELLLNFPTRNGTDHLEIKDESGKTPVDYLIIFESINCIELLMSMNRLNLEATNQAGMSLIHQAAWQNKPLAIRCLSEFGCDLDSLSRDGFAPLHIAVRNNYFFVVRALLESGANPNILSDTRPQQPPANYAEDSNILGYLLAFGGRYDNTKEPVRGWENDEVELYSGMSGTFVNSEKCVVLERSISKQDEEWMADSSSSMCVLCGKGFNFSFRRHHCRGCGRLVCKLCSSRQLLYQMDPATTTPLRSCDLCVNKAHYSSTQLVKKKINGKIHRLSPAEELEYEITGNVEGRELHDPTSAVMESQQRANFTGGALGGALSGGHQMISQLQENMERTAEIEKQSEQVVDHASEFEQLAARVAAKNKR